jgi:hypothetical protein
MLELQRRKPDENRDDNVETDTQSNGWPTGIFMAADAGNRATGLMNMTNNHHKHSPDHGSSHNAHTPAWMRLHHDWRFWVAVILMFGCMIIYLMSDDLAWRPGVRSHGPPPPSVGQQ